MSYLVNDIADYLATQGRGTVGTDIFVGYMPPDTNGLAVLDSGGLEPDKYIPTKEPTFQVFVRSVNYSTGKALIDNIRGDLHRKFNSTIGGNYYYFILATSEGRHLGRDDEGKDTFQIDFRVRTR